MSNAITTFSLPKLGNLEQYIASVNKYPILSKEEESKQRKINHLLDLRYKSVIVPSKTSAAMATVSDSVG